jgi:hypothetical protein
MSNITGFTSGPTSSGLLTWYAATLNCGHQWSERSNPWVPLETKKVGDEVFCEVCKHQTDNLAWLEALDPKVVFRSRFDPRFGGQYHFYRRDHDSPSGVILIGGVAATPAIDELLRKKRISPLSPTER